MLCDEDFYKGRSLHFTRIRGARGEFTYKKPAMAPKMQDVFEACETSCRPI